MEEDSDNYNYMNQFEQSIIEMKRKLGLSENDSSIEVTPTGILIKDNKIFQKLANTVTMKGVYTFTLENILTKAKRVFVYENLVPTVGRTMIADNLTNATPDNDMLANYIALGTGTNAPANGDTTLQTEVYRNNTASRTNASNIAYISGFIDATETTGTYREAGIFCDGTSSANTGILLSRVAINITKSSIETLTLDWTLTIA
jgi:hypothetical protein